MKKMSYEYYNNFSLILPLTIVIGFALVALLSITLPLRYSIKKTYFDTLNTISEALHGFWLTLREENYVKVDMDFGMTDRIALKVLDLQNRNNLGDSKKLNKITDELHDLREAIKLLNVGRPDNVQMEKEERKFQAKLKLLLDFLKNSQNSCIDETVAKINDMLTKSKRHLKNLKKERRQYEHLFLLYPFVGFIVLVFDSMLIFFSNIILSRSTGTCDVHKDCFAVYLNSSEASGLLTYETCQDYLSNKNVLIQCYKLSFNYWLAFNRASSVISLGSSFLGFEFAMLGICIYIGRSNVESFYLVMKFFCVINIFTFIFTFLFLVGLIYYVINNFHSFSYLDIFEIFMNFVRIIYTMLIPIIITTCMNCYLYSIKKPINVRSSENLTNQTILEANSLINDNRPQHPIEIELQQEGALTVQNEEPVNPIMESKLCLL